MPTPGSPCPLHRKLSSPRPHARVRTRRGRGLRRRGRGLRPRSLQWLPAGCTSWDTPSVPLRFLPSSEIRAVRRLPMAPESFGPRSNTTVSGAAAAAMGTSPHPQPEPTEHPKPRWLSTRLAAQHGRPCRGRWASSLPTARLWGRPAFRPGRERQGGGGPRTRSAPDLKVRQVTPAHVPGTRIPVTWSFLASGEAHYRP